MATRSRIGILNSNDSVVSIYCHWDGYPSNNGKILLEDYKTTAKIKKLLVLGSLSSLAKNPGKPPINHSFDNKIEGYVTAYHRDRGDKDALDIVHSENISEFLLLKEDYSYLWNGNYWLVCSYPYGTHQTCADFHELTKSDFDIE